MKQCWSAVLLGWIFHNISKTCGLRKEKWLLHQMMNTLICSVILSGFASVTDKDKQDRQNYCSKYCTDGKNTCEPDGAATKTSTLAKHLSSLGSGYMMSLVSHIRGPQCWLQHTHTHTGALVTLTVQIVWRYIDLYPAWSVTIYWLGGVETRGGRQGCGTVIHVGLFHSVCKILVKISMHLETILPKIWYIHRHFLKFLTDRCVNRVKGSELGLGCHYQHRKGEWVDYVLPILQYESKKQDNKLLPITSPTFNRFSKFISWQTQW